MKSPRTYTDLEIARYVLGLYMPEQSRQVQKRLALDDAAAACALKWEAYFLDIVDALPPAPVSDTVLLRIEQSLGMQGHIAPGADPNGQAVALNANGHAGAGDTPAAAGMVHQSQVGKSRAGGRRIRPGRLALAAGTGLAICVAVLVFLALMQPVSVEEVQQPLSIQID